MINDLMNPVKLIEFILNFAKGVVDFMSTNVYIPTLGTYPVWGFIVTALAPILLYVLIKRLVL